ncbi:CHRD domain-containing protein [Telluria mixta]|uniref:CHRD domain-containing protein n=1 Tax=Telluria mixta TaxID=34071 RepID=A0ABT2BU42_9BURK|nr:CHRD domain-containing protein [Telluria mixta]MCS0628638.1 CHRD domain-containing protein [Telluria mixta]WEM93262.1 CHRD domain-containing protein [Telluria mixta]
MKRVLSVLALAAASTALAVPAAAAPADPSYRAVASGALESPPNASPGTSLVTIDLGGTQLLVDLPFRDLVGTTTAAHIHCCTSTAFTGTAPVAVPFQDFPLGVTAGSYNQAIPLDDPSFWDPAFVSAHGGTVAGATSAFVDGVNANEAYVNIHTDLYPNGEIRGWLVAAPPVPETAEWSMLAVGLAGLMWMSRRRPTV